MINKIRYYTVYQYYKTIMREMVDEVDPIYIEKFKEISKNINNLYKDITFLYELENTEHDKEYLNENVLLCFNDFFKREHIFLFKSLVNTLEVDEDVLDSYYDTEENIIVMNQYKNFEDVQKLMNMILRVFMYKIEEDEVYSQVLPRTFELIAAEAFEERLIRRTFVSARVCEIVQSIRFDCDLFKAYKKTRPIVVPYYIADILAYELYLYYKDNFREFNKYINDIFSKKITVQEFLNSIGLDILNVDISSIASNHHKILLPNQF